MTPILIVDDSRADVRLLTLWLQRSPRIAAVHVAHSGREALERLRDSQGPLANQRPLILLDVHLPDMLGWEFLQAVREDPALQSLSIVVLTGTEREDDRARAAQLGAIRYLGKPFDADEFSQLVTVIEGLL